MNKNKLTSVHQFCTLFFNRKYHDVWKNWIKHKHFCFMCPDNLCESHDYQIKLNKIKFRGKKTIGLITWQYANLIRIASDEDYRSWNGSSSRSELLWNLAPELHCSRRLSEYWQHCSTALWREDAHSRAGEGHCLSFYSFQQPWFRSDVLAKETILTSEVTFKHRECKRARTRSVFFSPLLFLLMSPSRQALAV